jgi:hypothetical protein
LEEVGDLVNGEETQNPREAARSKTASDSSQRSGGFEEPTAIATFL